MGDKYIDAKKELENYLNSIQINGEGGIGTEGTEVSGKVGYTHPINKEELENYLNRFQISGEGGIGTKGTEVSGRVGYTHPINKGESINVGASGHYVKGKGFKDAGIDRAEATYRKQFKDAEIEAMLGANLNKQAGKRGIDKVGASYTQQLKDDAALRAKFGANLNETAGKRGLDEFMIEYEKSFKKGGAVKKKSKKKPTIKVRGHGCEKRGKTKGRFV